MYELTPMFIVSWQPNVELVSTRWQKILARKNIVGRGMSTLEPLENFCIRLTYTHFDLQPISQNETWPEVGGYLYLLVIMFVYWHVSTEIDSLASVPCVRGYSKPSKQLK